MGQSILDLDCAHRLRGSNLALHLGDLGIDTFFAQCQNCVQLRQLFTVAKILPAKEEWMV